MNKEDLSAFCQRLAYVCELDGLTAPQLAKLCEVTERTARRWLQGICAPHASHTLTLNLPRQLRVSPSWLWCGDGLNPEHYRLIQFYESLNTWEQGQFQRLQLRLVNGNVKADRLMDLFVAGQISRTQLFQAM